MRYVVLLRGINVGKHVVKMAELAKMLEEMGYTDVRTYIQSGNVVLGSEWSAQETARRITERFAARFGFTTAILLRDTTAMRMLAAQLPFPADAVMAAQEADPAVEHLYVYFLEQIPTKEAIAQATVACEPGDAVRLGKQEVYLLCRESIRLSKVALQLNKAFPQATVRNWKTVQKLKMMLEDEAIVSHPVSESGKREGIDCL